MATYVTSDIHGCYSKYIQIYDKIDFKDEDLLFVLGDVVDRGPEPMKVLKDMMTRPNVIPLIGNHEVLALACLKCLVSEITSENISRLSSDMMELLLEWIDDGGQSTIEDFARLSRSDRRDILDYLGEFSLYDILTINGKGYLLVHGGLENFSPDRLLEEYSPEEMVFSRPDYSKIYLPGVYLVTGHTPTRLIKENPQPDCISRANNHIAIDCGCVFGGKLAVFRLDDGQEFYI